VGRRSGKSNHLNDLSVSEIPISSYFKAQVQAAEKINPG